MLPTSRTLKCGGSMAKILRHGGHVVDAADM
jgi:hypothetical protein